MKYEYKGATGNTEIEVDEQFFDILVSLDKEEFNSDRKHSRRNPLSLEDTEYEGEWFADGSDLLGDLIRAESNARLHAVLLRLTADQQTLVDRVYFKNEKIVDIARRDGVSHVAILDRLKRIHKKLKNYL